MEKSLRALRGATTVDEDTPESISAATRELLTELAQQNGFDAGDIVSAIFTVTPDLRSEFPARAARSLGWEDVSLLCTTEIPVPGALERCIRVLLHVETGRVRAELKHCYLRGARALRPDLIT